MQPPAHATPVVGRRRYDYAVALGLFLGYLLVLLLTVKNLGYARDEGFYFEAASSYGKWFDLLLKSPSQAIQKVNVDRYWTLNHEHPALIKTLFWWSRKLLFGLPLLGEQGTSFRFPGMALSALAVSMIYLWGAEVIGGGIGRAASLMAAVSFGFLPRIFYHAHLACFDLPVTAMWLLTTYVYWKSTRRSAWGWVLATAVCYGLLLDTKHNSWLLPAPLVLHFVLDRITRLRAVHTGRIGFPLSWLSTIVLAPAVFYTAWPWIWFDTVHRLEEYVRFHTGHVYYNMEFLGQTYFRAPMPRLYPWVMTVATVPATTLVLFLIGLVVTWREGLWPVLVTRCRELARAVRRSPQSALRAPAVVEPSEPERLVQSTHLLWLLCILVSYAPWLSSKTPIFGGTKHWLTAYPFLCLFAGVGLAALCRRVAAGASRARAIWVTGVSAALAALVPVVIGVHAHPWGLSAYTPLVGGAPGAATLGLNRTFWGYTTGSLQDFINRTAQKNARVFVHDTAFQSWQMMEKDKRLRKDLRPWGEVHGSELALYHHEQHMSRVEFMTWVDYGTVSPSQIGAFDGVPVVWIFTRPKGSPSDGPADPPPM